MVTTSGDNYMDIVDMVTAKSNTNLNKYKQSVQSDLLDVGKRTIVSLIKFGVNKNTIKEVTEKACSEKCTLSSKN